MAADTHYDAFMKIGPASYLVLNHTSKTLTEIRADGKWLAVQAILFELSIDSWRKKNACSFQRSLSERRHRMQQQHLDKHPGPRTVAEWPGGPRPRTPHAPA